VSGAAGIVLAALVGYLVGSSSPAMLVARAQGVDLLRSGSGNPGATNVGRVLGRRFGVLVGLLDVLKGLLPTVAAAAVVGEAAALVAGLAAVLGHVTSPWLRGHGGKGVATSFGAMLGVVPWWALLAFGVFGLVVAASRWVALASMAAALTVVVLAGTAVAAGWDSGSWSRLWWATALAAVVLARHRSNVLTRWRQWRA